MFCCRMFCCRSKSFTLAQDVQHSENRRSSTPPPIVDEPQKQEEKPKKNDQNGKSQVDSLDVVTEEIKEPERPSDDNLGGGIETRRGGIFQAYKVDPNVIIPEHSKSDKVAETIRCAILNNEFMNDVIPNKEIDKVVSAMSRREVHTGEVIIQQGNFGDHFYVNESGSYEVIVNNEVVHKFSEPKIFGELAVLYKTKRAATVKALSDGVIWMIEGTIYTTIMVQSARSEEKQKLEFLKKVPAVKGGSLDKLQLIAKLLKTQFYASKTAIVRQGDVGDKFYLIKAGKVTVTIHGQGIVATLGEGDYFGERALIESDVRQATCSAEPPGVTCLELSRHDFITHLGDFDEFMQKSSLYSSTNSSARESVIDTSSDPEDDRSSLPDFNELEPMQIIGVGGFGRVQLMRGGNTYYALKMLSKAENSKGEQRTHVINEKNIQKDCTSPFIVRLYGTYIDDRYLYFLMEVCMGGDLFSLMQRQKGRRFDEDGARFIAGCILQALAYLHSKDFIYRDLKPENMLIDASGYIKLADFGFAKKLKRTDSTYTFAGTPEYVAPEVIYNKGHNRAVDYWAFGIFIFELLAGKTPFKTSDPSYMKTYGLILRGIDIIQFPPRINKPAMHLIKKLCRITPHERLGCQKAGVADIRNHKWFAPLDFDKLNEKKIPSKFKPDLDFEYDTKYFDEFGDNFPEPEKDESDWSDFYT